MKRVTVLVYSHCESPFHKKPWTMERTAEVSLFPSQNNLAERNLSSQGARDVLVIGYEVTGQHGLTACPFGIKVKATVDNTTINLTDNWRGRLK